MTANLPMDEVGIHTRQKQALLTAYLKVWTLNVAANHGPEAPSLDIYDLFAGTGRCIEREYRQDEWKGTPLVSAEQLKHYPSKRGCYLVMNSWAETEETRVAQLAALKERIADTKLERTNRKVIFLSEEFSTALPKALAIHANRPQYPSLWILDPYKAHAVPWSSVKAIADQVGTWNDRAGQKRSRRPELFIHFITSTLQRNVHNPGIIAEALGCTVQEWKAHLQTVEATGGSVLDALSSFYYDQLQKLYGREPFAVNIPGKDGNPVSVVFFAVERDAAWHSIRKETLPYFGQWLKQEYRPRKEWVRARHKLDRDIPPGQKQTGLYEPFD
jgi:three-Cys-motif partner protein